MKAEDFRRIALSMPEAVESAHMGHPDFRISAKVFASLGYPDKLTGTLMLSPAEQNSFLQAYPAAFFPAKGAWGERGATCVRLEVLDPAVLRSAMVEAWRYKAPKRLAKQNPDP